MRFGGFGVGGFKGHTELFFKESKNKNEGIMHKKKERGKKSKGREKNMKKEQFLSAFHIHIAKGKV